MSNYAGKIKKYDAVLAALYHMVRELDDQGLDTSEERKKIKVRRAELAAMKEGK